MPNRDFFTSRGAYVNLRYTALIRLQISCRTRWWYLKCVIVYLARDIPAFVMYCVNGDRLYDINLARIVMRSFEMAPQNLGYASFMFAYIIVCMYCTYYSQWTLSR